MYNVTDLKPIELAYESAAPRDLEEMMAENYPDAVRDVNGRYHSPRDGYHCKLTDRIFRGGEYLPFDEAATSPHRYIVKAMYQGQVVEWECTMAQYAAIAPIIRAQSLACDAAVSEHIGAVGDKVTLELIIQRVKAYEGLYGPIFYVVMKTLEGSVVFYKGAKHLGNEEQTIKLQGKVKSHDIRDDVKSTRIERPKLIK